jgi:CheY-like chemotaxis protein
MGLKKILVIDDEEAILEVIQCCLEDLGGWEVQTANSGKEGVILAQRQRFDAVLLDVSMPEMDGIQTFQSLQENPVTNYLPVILLTAKVQPNDRDRFSQLKIAGTLAKPFDPMTLVQQVANVLHWD